MPRKKFGTKARPGKKYWNITRMSTPAASANQALAANAALAKVPNGAVSAGTLNAAKNANKAVVNAAVQVVNAQAKAVNAAANATTVPNKANAANVQKALNAVNRTMKNLQNMRAKAVNANKNVVRSILNNNAVN
jgi:hypothetical protein